ncbi:MAG: hypothetical protein FJ149_04995 [Euryarchaeota archaeon]|nr:hypothetical protein [Euryarchaeota archaeon]
MSEFTERMRRIIRLPFRPMEPRKPDEAARIQIQRAQNQLTNTSRDRVKEIGDQIAAVELDLAKTEGKDDLRFQALMSQLVQLRYERHKLKATLRKPIVSDRFQHRTIIRERGPMTSDEKIKFDRRQKMIAQSLKMRRENKHIQIKKLKKKKEQQAAQQAVKANQPKGGHPDSLLANAKDVGGGCFEFPNPPGSDDVPAIKASE